MTNSEILGDRTRNVSHWPNLNLESSAEVGIDATQYFPRADEGVTNIAQEFQDKSHPRIQYVVAGLISWVNGVPKERLIKMTKLWTLFRSVR